MLRAVMAIADSALMAATPAEASACFFDAIRPHGATYLQSRIYRRPSALLTSQTHWAAGGFVARYAPAGWVGSPAFDYICFEHNPLLAAIRGGRTRYRFSDFAAHDEAAHGEYWSALSEASIGEALCATAYGADRRIASFHIGFAERDIEPGVADAVLMAGNILAERLITFETPGEAASALPLSVRERDALMLVAEGKTDWEIATIMGFSESTSRFHVDNARRKLDCVNRAHAVARFLALYDPLSLR